MMIKTLFIGLLSLVLFASSTQAYDLGSAAGPGGLSITAFDRDSKRQIGGYFDTEFFKGDGYSKFVAHRLVFEVSSYLHPNLLFNSEIEYEYGADTDNQGEIKIEQLWIDFEISEWMTYRTGIVVVPFGIVNILHDSDVRDTTNRPIYSKYIVPSTWMDTGVGIHGLFDKQDWEFAYSAFVLNGLTSTRHQVTDNYGIRKLRPNFKEDNNENKAVVLRFTASPFQGLTAGTSYYTGNHDDEDNSNLSMIGLDAMFKKGPFEILGEWAKVDVEGQDINTLSGYYVETRYHLPATFAIFKQNFDRPVFTLFARISEVDPDTDNETQYDRTQVTLGINYRPVDTVVYKCAYEFNSEAVDNGVDNDQLVLSVAVGF